MRILLSIKSVLNYLYNNLIDLIWVRVLRFSDGTEMTTVPQGNNLYDIKLLSQIIADKGWAFMCHTNRRDLSKSLVPTLYDDILFKYVNADKHYVTSETTNQNMTCVTYDKYTQKYYYRLNEIGQQYYVYTSNYPDLSNSTIALTSSEQLSSCLICGKNINIVSSSINRLFHIYNKNWEFIKTFDKNDIMNNYVDLRCFRAVNGAIILTFSREDNSNGECYVVKINDDLTANISYTENLFTTSRPLPNSISEVINNKFYITVGRGFSITLVEIDINDLSNYTIKNQSDINVYPDLTKYNFSEVVFYNDYFYITAVNKIYKSQNLVNWTQVYTATGNNWRIIKDGNDYFIFGDGYILQTNNFTNFSTLLTFTFSSGMGEGVSNFCNVTDGVIIISSTGNPKFYLYSAPTIKVYTDTYTINGNSITIDYYKYNDFKICLSDGGTNDSNLETVYSYLGYLNYWIIDTANETIAIQRNSQPFACMFVGDDFQDDSLNLPTQSVRCLPQAEIIVDSSASITLDILAGKNYIFTNTDITDITFDSCQDSTVETTIQFVTGATAPTLTDNSNLSWNGGVPTLNANKTYTMVIFNNKVFYEER